jgi:hypothetical protein
MHQGNVNLILVGCLAVDLSFQFYDGAFLTHCSFSCLSLRTELPIQAPSWDHSLLKPHRRSAADAAAVATCRLRSSSTCIGLLRWFSMNSRLIHHRCCNVLLFQWRKALLYSCLQCSLPKCIQIIKFSITMADPLSFCQCSWKLLILLVVLLVIFAVLLVIFAAKKQVFCMSVCAVENWCQKPVS